MRLFVHNSLKRFLWEGHVRAPSLSFSLFLLGDSLHTIGNVLFWRSSQRLGTVRAHACANCSGSCLFLVFSGLWFVPELLCFAILVAFCTYEERGRDKKHKRKHTILFKITTRIKFLFSNYLGRYSYSFRARQELISVTVTVLWV